MIGLMKAPLCDVLPRAISEKNFNELRASGVCTLDQLCEDEKLLRWPALRARLGNAASVVPASWYGPVVKCLSPAGGEVLAEPVLAVPSAPTHTSTHQQNQSTAPHTTHTSHLSHTSTPTTPATHPNTPCTRQTTPHTAPQHSIPQKHKQKPGTPYSPNIAQSHPSKHSNQP